ncbi:hypothetical protein [Emticicia fontis]
MRFFKTSKQDDEQLLQSMRNGNELALNRLIEKYSGRIRGFLRNQGSEDDENNKTYTNDAFLILYETYGRNGKIFDHSRGTVFSYLCQVAKHKFLNDRRGNKFDFDDIEEGELNDPEGLSDFYDELDKKAFKAFNKKITLEVVMEYMFNIQCFSDRCLKLYSLDYKKLGLDDFNQTIADLASNYLEHEERIKDETIALEMTRWSDKNEIPPQIYNENLVRVTRRRCKEDLRRCILGAGYVW